MGAVTVAVDHEPLTKQDLVAFLASGCKPKKMWRIGAEYEKFGFEVDTLRPMNYDQITKLLNGIAEKFNWEKIIEDDHIIGLKKGMQNITLEAGGQLELGGAPFENLHQTWAELKTHLDEVNSVAKEMDIEFLGIGFQPKWRVEDTPLVPMSRARIMLNHFHKLGASFDIPFRTCSAQANLDFSSEADMVRKLRVGLALQPIATALFANSLLLPTESPMVISASENKENRSGMLPFVFEDSFGFEKYVDYALDVPMICVYRKNKCISCSGSSFRDFMQGKLPILPGEFATIKDWEIHLGTLYPEVRLKRYLEMRGADCGPLSSLCAIPAFWVGLLYDDESLQNAIDMISDWTNEEREMMRKKATILGLKTPFRDGTLGNVAEEVVKLAMDGLKRRGLDEDKFLYEVAEVARAGVTSAERLLEKYHGEWEQNVDGVFAELRY